MIVTEYSDVVFNIFIILKYKLCCFLYVFFCLCIYKYFTLTKIGCICYFHYSKYLLFSLSIYVEFLSVLSIIIFQKGGCLFMTFLNILHYYYLKYFFFLKLSDSTKFVRINKIVFWKLALYKINM